MTRWAVPPMFAGQTVAVLASGPSMSLDVARSVRHLPRIAVNTTYRLARDADVIYASDARWWHANADALQCPGIKATIEVRPRCADPLPAGVRVLRNTGRDGFDPDPSAARTYGNSGAVAIQIAAHARAARVLLLGFDMHGDHWHAPHDDLNPTRPDFARWRAGMARLARLLPRGVDVINCTPGSALTCFPSMSLADALTMREAA